MAAKKPNGIVRAKYMPELVMVDWRELMQAIVNMNEAELQAALDFEIKRPKADRRGDFIKRLHSKLVTMQVQALRDEAAKELEEMMP